MKILIYCLIAIAAGLLIYNFTFLDFDSILQRESKTALIGVLASGCVILLLVILLISKSIAKKAGGR